MIHIFIINPEAGRDVFSEELRKQLRKRQKIKYFIFTTKGKGSETKQIQEIIDLFEEEELRIYCCGGAGTIRNILNGLREEDFNRVELAFYPCGLSNDFLKVFGEEEKYFKDLDALIDGQVLAIDYIQTNYGRALNAVSTGTDGLLIKGVEDYRYLNLLNKNVPYLAALIEAMLKMSPRQMVIQADEKNYQVQVIEMMMGNGCVLNGAFRFAENTDITDGSGEYHIAKKDEGVSMLKMMLHFMSKKTENREKSIIEGASKHMQISMADGSEFSASFDGELVENIRELDLTMVEQGLRFVLPKGVNLHER